MKTAGQRSLVQYLVWRAADVGVSWLHPLRLGRKISNSRGGGLLTGTSAVAMKLQSGLLGNRPPPPPRKPWNHWRVWLLLRRFLLGFPLDRLLLAYILSLLAKAMTNDKAFPFTKQMNVSFLSDSWKKLFVTEPSPGLLY